MSTPDQAPQRPSDQVFRRTRTMSDLASDEKVDPPTTSLASAKKALAGIITIACVSFAVTTMHGASLGQSIKGSQSPSRRLQQTHVASEMGNTTFAFVQAGKTAQSEADGVENQSHRRLQIADLVFCSQISTLCNDIRYPSGFEEEYASQCILGCDDCNCNCARGLFGKEVCFGRWDRVPVRLKVQYSTLSACDLAKSAGMDIEKLLGYAETLCSCKSKVADLAQELMNAGVADSPTADVIRIAAEVVSCLIDGGFSVESPDEHLLQDYRRKADVILLERIDFQLYLQVIGAFAACAFGDCAAVVSVLIDYVEKSLDKLGAGVSALLTSKIVDVYLVPLKSLLTTATELQVDTALLDQCLDSVETHVQTQVDTLNTHAATFKQAVAEVQGGVQELLNVGGLIDSLISKVRDAVEAVNALSQHLDVSSLNLGSITELPSLVTGVPAVIDALENVNVFVSRSTADVEHTIVDMGESVERAASSIEAANQVLSEALQTGATPECAAFKAQAADLRAQASSLPHVLSSISEVGSTGARALGNIRLEVGSLTMRKEFTISAKLPCLTSGRKTFGPPDMRVETEFFPEIYECDSSMQVPLPNEHLPYVRFVTDESPGLSQPALPLPSFKFTGGGMTPIDMTSSLSEGTYETNDGALYWCNGAGACCRRLDILTGGIKLVALPDGVVVDGDCALGAGTYVTSAGEYYYCNGASECCRKVQTNAGGTPLNVLPAGNKLAGNTIAGECALAAGTYTIDTGETYYCNGAKECCRRLDNANGVKVTSLPSTTTVNGDCSVGAGTYLALDGNYYYCNGLGECCQDVKVNIGAGDLALFPVDNELAGNTIVGVCSLGAGTFRTSAGESYYCSGAGECCRKVEVAAGGVDIAVLPVNNELNGIAIVGDCSLGAGTFRTSAGESYYCSGAGECCRKVEVAAGGADIVVLPVNDQLNGVAIVGDCSLGAGTFRTSAGESYYCNGAGECCRKVEVDAGGADIAVLPVNDQLNGAAIVGDCSLGAGTFRTSAGESYYCNGASACCRNVAVGAGGVEIEVLPVNSQLNGVAIVGDCSLGDGTFRTSAGESYHCNGAGECCRKVEVNPGGTAIAFLPVGDKLAGNLIVGDCSLGAGTFRTSAGESYYCNGAGECCRKVEVDAGGVDIVVLPVNNQLSGVAIAGDCSLGAGTFRTSAGESYYCNGAGACCRKVEVGAGGVDIALLPVNNQLNGVAIVGVCAGTYRTPAAESYHCNGAGECCRKVYVHTGGRATAILPVGNNLAGDSIVGGCSLGAGTFRTSAGESYYCNGAGACCRKVEVSAGGVDIAVLPVNSQLNGVAIVGDCTLPTGAYRTPNGAIHYANSGNHYCVYPYWEAYVAAGQPGFIEVMNMPVQMRFDGHCLLPAGVYRTPDGAICAANHVGHYCAYRDWGAYTRAGTPAWVSIPYWPGTMQSDGFCII